ncbi:MAG: MFS transporter, partial [Myxococcales bacterium]|nr:MFS transporter [Myxococcales bacterium]
MSPPVRIGLLDVFRSRRVLVLALLGFSSGLPLLLTAQTLTAWLTAAHVDLATIGTLSLVGLPYTFKWAWAPLLDRYRLPLLGRRRGWILVLQLALAAAIAAMGTVEPRTEPAALAVLAVLVATLSASQDVVIDAFNADTLHPEERAAGSAMYVLGYRTAMLVSGTLALVLADHLPWRTIYLIVAALMGLGVVGTLLAIEPAEAAARPASLVEAAWRPLAALLRRRRIAIVLGFVALFRFGELMVNQMVIPFLKDGAGFSFTEIATLYKVLGFAGTVVGGLTAGALVARWGARRCLIVFGVAQASTNLCYLALAVTGRSLPVLGAAVVIDNLASAMGTGAFVAYLMSLCDRAFSATQYALLTSLSSLLARVLGFAGAALVAAAGWPAFWAATAAVAVPALALVAW